MFQGRGFDISPVTIENPEGKKEYQTIQEALYEKSRPIRSSLLTYYDMVLRELPTQDPEMVGKTLYAGSNSSTTTAS